MKRLNKTLAIIAQFAVLSFVHSLVGATSTCSIDWSDVVGLRVDVDDSENCGGGSSSSQNPTANADLKNGDICGDYVLAITVKGTVEDQDSGFDYVYVNGTLYFSSRGSNADCSMLTQTETRQITVKATDPIVLEYDTVDGLYHTGAYAEITNVSIVSGPGCNQNGCSTCGGAGGGSAGNSSVDVRVSVGDPEMGKYPGMFRVKTETPDASIYTTAAIEYGVDIDADVEEIRDAGGAIRQVLTSQVLADLVTVGSLKYEIRFYYASDTGTKSGNVYVPTGTPYKVWTFEDPDNGAGSNYQLKVTESVDGNDTIHDYTWIPANQNWTLVSAGLKEIGRKNSTIGSNRIETYWVKTPGGSDSYRRDTTFQTFAWGEEQVSETLDPLNPSGGRITIWTYYSDQVADGNNYSRLKLLEEPDGYWESYQYDSEGRVLKTISPAGDSSPTDSGALSRVVEWTYQTTAPQVARVERYKGEEVERRYTVYNENITQQILAANPGATWDAAGNLVTETELVGGSGEFSDQIEYVRYSDGTIQQNTYSRDSVTKELTTVSSEGAPNAGKTVVIDGLETTTIEDIYGNLISETVTDIASGLTLSFQLVTSSDELGRPLRIDYLDGTYETFVYSCCGLSTYTNREGVVTSYFYDALKRRTSEVQNGITHEHIYDSSDRVIEEARIGTDTSRMVLMKTAYGPDTRLLWTEGARGFKSNYTYGQTAGGGETTTITHEADVSTQIHAYYRDRRTAELNGTSTRHLKYLYGANSSGLSWTQEIKVGISGSETEWVKTYENMLEQTTLIENPDGAESTYAYNSLGLLVRQTDPDGVQMLYEYNAAGEQIVQALDLNQNDLIDYTGSDRIERTTTAVVDISGTTYARQTLERWETNGADTPTSYSSVKQAADGSIISTTTDGLTETISEACDSANGTCTITKTSTDGLSEVKAYDQGQLVSLSLRDENAQILRSMTYTYDAHGRLETETLSGVGTTTYTYTVDDQIASIVSPDPDTNESGEGYDAFATQYVYDNLGRLVMVVHPDNAETKTSYYSTGQIKRKWGARTYPLEFTYDPQGRLLTMKTWKDFDADTGAETTSWQYDSQRGWLSAKQYADGNGPTYTYTDAGRLKTRTWARGITTTYGYANSGDLSSVTYSDSTPSVAYTQDRMGRRETTSDAAGVLTSSYSGEQVTVESYAGTGLLAGKSLSRTLDAKDRISGLSATGIDPLTFGYDTASRLASVSQGNRVASYTFGNELDTIEAVTIQNNSVERYRLSRSHDLIGRVTRIDTLGNTSVLHTRRDYRHNSANQRSSMADKNGCQWQFAYDSLGQLISAQKFESADGGVVPGYVFDFAFDDIGNRLSTTTNDRLADYNSNALNQYTQRDYPGAVDVRGAAPEHVGIIVNGERTERTDGDFYAPATADNSSGSVELNIIVKAVDPGPPELLAVESRDALIPETPETFTYDLDGNLTQDGLWNYEWDAENRLVVMETRIDLPNSVTRKRLEFAYDSRSRRILKTVKEYNSGASSWTTASQTKFLYDGWNLLAEYDALNSDVLIRSHVWGVDLSNTPQGVGGVGGLLWSIQSGTSYAPGFDANGNIVSWVNLSDGALVGSAEYGAFGERLVLNGLSVDLPFGFRRNMKIQRRVCSTMAIASIHQA